MHKRKTDIKQPPALKRFRDMLFGSRRPGEDKLFKNSMDIARAIARSNAATMDEKDLQKKGSQIAGVLRWERPFPDSLRQEIITAVKERVTEKIPIEEQNDYITQFHYALKVFEDTRNTLYEPLNPSSNPRDSMTGMNFVTIPYLKEALGSAKSRAYFTVFATIFGLTNQILPGDFAVPERVGVRRFTLAFTSREDAVLFWESILEAGLITSAGAPLFLGDNSGLMRRTKRLTDLLLSLESLGYLSMYVVPWEACLTAVTLYQADGKNQICYAMLYPESFQVYPLPQSFVEGWKRFYDSLIAGDIKGASRVYAADFALDSAETAASRISTALKYN